MLPVSSGIYVHCRHVLINIKILPTLSQVQLT